MGWRRPSISGVIMTAPRTSAGRGRFVVLAGWFVAVSIPLVPLAVQHAAPLGRAAPARAVAPSDVTVRHVLSASCRCSLAVASHLVARGARKAEVEEIWLVGTDDALTRQLQSAGYRVRPATAQDVRRDLGSAGAPFLIVYGTDARELYAGGYGPRRPRDAGDVRDVAIVDQARRGQTVTPYPPYGCLGEFELAM
jgi:hypothetical protein